MAKRISSASIAESRSLDERVEIGSHLGMMWMLMFTTVMRLLWGWRRRALLVVAPLLVAATPARTLEDRLHDAALAQPRPWYAPHADTPGARETLEEYEARVGTAMRALTRVTVREREDGTHAVVPPTWWYGRKAIVAAVLAHWYEESRLAYEIHAGIDHPVWDQDKGRARCMGQLHVGLVPLYDWEALAGLDDEATERCALWTARALTRMALYCGKGRRGVDKLNDVLLGMFSAMGGNGCAPTVSGRAKVARFGKIWREMERR